MTFSKITLKKFIVFSDIYFFIVKACMKIGKYKIVPCVH